MKEIRFCEHCQQARQTEVTTHRKSLKVKGKTVQINAKTRICASCHKHIYDEKLDNALSEQAIRAYNETYGVNGEDIVAFRKKHQMTQETLAKLIGIAKKTLISYEKNRAVPQQSHLNTLRLILDDPGKLKKMADLQDHDLSEKEREIVDNLDKDDLTEYNGFMPYQKDLVKKSILFFAQNKISMTRLMKGLFFLDFNHYRKNAVSLTGLTYWKYEHGPFNKVLYECVAELVEEGSLQAEEMQKNGETFSLYSLGSKPGLDAFDREQKALLEAIGKYLSDSDAQNVSNDSHDEQAWKETPLFQPISYVHALNMKNTF